VIDIIKVNAIGSTNGFLKELVKSKTVTQTTCLWTKKQTNGRGQMGNSWQTEDEKNLTFSIYTPIILPFIQNPITINLLTTLCIYKVLKLINIPQLYIKWPNDIMSVNKKIGGILIENTYQNGVLSGSIIGIGLNVNQEKFKNLPQASSLKKITNHQFDIELLLKQILNQFEKTFFTYDNIHFSSLKETYEAMLFRKGKPSSFIKTDTNLMFTGIIRGITNNGKLIVLEEDNITNLYNLKEIRLLY